MSDIKVGDEVRVFDRYNLRSRAEDYPGRIVKVGRTLVTVSYGPEGGCSREDQFRMDTGRINDGYGNLSFRTLAQLEREQRAQVAIEVLKEAGLEIGIGRSPSPELLVALAAVVETFGQEG